MAWAWPYGQELPPPDLPHGLRLRALRGAKDLPRRVAVHRAAFHPSRVTEESCLQTMAA